METKAEYTTVCTDELNALILDVQEAGKKIAFANEHYGYSEQQCSEAAKARDDLRLAIDAIVTGGITAQIAEHLEHIAALQERITAMEFANDALNQVIRAQTGRIAELEKAIIESGIKADLLKAELREMQE